MMEKDPNLRSFRHTQLPNDHFTRGALATVAPRATKPKLPIFHNTTDFPNTEQP